jgi:hypothetical protein
MSSKSHTYGLSPKQEKKSDMGVQELRVSMSKYLCRQSFSFLGYFPSPSCFLSGIFHFSQPPRSSEQGADYEPWRMAHGPRMTSMNGMYKFR